MKLIEGVTPKDLQKYNIYPNYECNSMTGEVRISGYYLLDHTGRSLSFKRKRRNIIHRVIKHDLIKDKIYYELVFVEHGNDLISLDVLYDLIKDGIVEKGD